MPLPERAHLAVLLLMGLICASCLPLHWTTPLFAPEGKALVWEHVPPSSSVNLHSKKIRHFGLRATASIWDFLRFSDMRLAGSVHSSMTHQGPPVGSLHRSASRSRTASRSFWSTTLRVPKTSIVNACEDCRLWVSQRL